MCVQILYVLVAINAQQHSKGYSNNILYEQDMHIVLNYFQTLAIVVYISVFYHSSLNNKASER